MFNISDINFSVSEKALTKQRCSSIETRKEHMKMLSGVWMERDFLSSVRFQTDGVIKYSKYIYKKNSW